MGVINTTPDSFSDGGVLYHGAKLNIDEGLKRAGAMVLAGVGIIDIGGESTRPGANTVSSAQEMDRVLPLLERIVAELDVITSVDSSSPELMTAAAAVGAGMINDVRSLTRPGALEAAAGIGLPICLMHMQGNPANMQSAPRYEDVVTEVCTYLAERVAACEQWGIGPERIILDPGFGFGKTAGHNLALLQNIPRLAEQGMPILVGLSRKSLIGDLIGREVGDRLPASLALAVLAVERGAHIIRTHDVAETVDAVAMAVALSGVNSDD
jgi:dihydropteroate synthase